MENFIRFFERFVQMYDMRMKFVALEVVDGRKLSVVCIRDIFRRQIGHFDLLYFLLAF